MTFVVIQLACSQPVLVVTAMVLADIRTSVIDHADQAPASVVTMSSMIFRPERAARADSVEQSTPWCRSRRSSRDSRTPRNDPRRAIGRDEHVWQPARDAVRR